MDQSSSNPTMMIERWSRLDEKYLAAAERMKEEDDRKKMEEEERMKEERSAMNQVARIRKESQQKIKKFWLTIHQYFCDDMMMEDRLDVKCAFHFRSQSYPELDLWLATDVLGFTRNEPFRLTSNCCDHLKGGTRDTDGSGFVVSMPEEDVVKTLEPLRQPLYPSVLPLLNLYLFVNDLSLLVMNYFDIPTLLSLSSSLPPK
jgi:hypothetical protein